MTNEELYNTVRETIANGCGCDRFCGYDPKECGCMRDAEIVIGLTINQAVRIAEDVRGWNDWDREARIAIDTVQQNISRITMG